MKKLRVYIDNSVVSGCFDEQFADEGELFVYQRNPRTGQMEVAHRDWQEIKSQSK